MALIDYDIDFPKLVGQLLGGLLKKPKRIAWLAASLKPVRNLHDTFLSYTEGIVYDIKWNGQTMKLEQLLIEQFGGGIYIINNNVEIDGAFIGAGSDIGFNIGAGNDNEKTIDVTYTISDFNFTVYVPGAIVFNQSEMEAIINKYKLHGTTYNIVII